MITKHTVLGIIAASGLAWRVADPAGSYAHLYKLSTLVTEFVAGSPLVSRVLSLVLLDQFNGVLIGIVFTALIQLFVLLIRRFTNLMKSVVLPRKHGENNHVPS